MNDALVRGKKLLDPAYVSKFVPNKPVGIFHSTADYVNDFKGSMEFFELLPGKDRKKKIYRYVDLCHSLPHETPERQYKVFKDVMEFLNDDILGSQSGNAPISANL